ncbi:MAG: neutral/alkaline non-lysosomal ceramidase N-terminal domain-containing protein [Planctomycetota bacterium]|nr:neutral/alkaline non-lysosomal ceramidase N-terminal domain-containing protein [Planctomycetota bacterium]
MFNAFRTRYRIFCLFYYRAVCLAAFLFSANCSHANEMPASWMAGFAKIDVTPNEPIRMAGYGNRDRPSESIDTPLFVRAMALRNQSLPIHLIFSVDTIGLPGEMTSALAEQIEKKHGLPRSQIVFCSTHTHCGPDLASELSNIFAKALDSGEVTVGLRYRDLLSKAILEGADKAIEDLAPANLAFAQGSVGFAANRRVLKDGRWSNFGVQADGPVDHTVPVLRITDEKGTLRGTVFNYACHCTTLGGDHFGINSEWAGYAANQIESTHKGSVALCTIGCGADANPLPRGKMEHVQQHGLSLATEVLRLLASPMTEIDQSVSATFGYAGLSFDLPTAEELVKLAEHATPQVRRKAVHLQSVLKEHGRLPATYPVPIQSWKFGDQLTMVFLGGEVVVDYAIRLKKELNAPSLWVTAYANDVMGYVCSERMRREGGYEFDTSSVYYNLPGPWAAGTEELFIKRIKEVTADRGRTAALAPDAALKTIQVADGLEIQLVASEPLVIDPINIAFGADGKLWVVEMGDYPLGTNDPSAAGRIKYLSDTDGDGTFDHATSFLEGLAYPTGVHPWKDGVIVSCAPDIFFARDTDGDGRADEQETWYTGFPLANPQHLVNGFTYGLDNSLHLASGDNLGELKSIRTGETVNASGRDVQIWPATGAIGTTSGRTQYVRSRNDWGEWFGNDNSRPMYHYPIEDRYLKRNSAVKYSGNMQFLFDPPSAPPVFPRSETVDRFNDLFAANRFTSACSAMILRSSALGKQFQDAAFICEPVHNLVHMSQLSQSNSSYHAIRRSEESKSEFLTSTDTWFRPTRIAEGPDGMLWLVDMYRDVIEHPEWIPESWQKQLNLRAGSDKGRIYRILPKSANETLRNPASVLPRLDKSSTEELARSLESDSGTMRDLTQQLLLDRDDTKSDDTKSTAQTLEQLARSSDSPQARLHAIWSLEAMHELSDDILEKALQDSHFGVVRSAILICERRLEGSKAFLSTFKLLTTNPDPRVQLQLALTLGESKSQEAGEILSALVPAALQSPWIARALISSATSHSKVLISACLSELQLKPAKSNNQPAIALISDLLATAQSNATDVEEDLKKAMMASQDDSDWTVPLTIAWVRSQSRTKNESDSAIKGTIQKVYKRAVATVESEEAEESARCTAIDLLGNGLGKAENEQAILSNLLSPRVPLKVQLAAVESLGRFSSDDRFNLVFSKWPSLSQNARNVVMSEFIRSRGGPEAILAAIESKTVSTSDLSPAIRQQLQSTGSQSNRAKVSRVLGIDASVDRNELVSKYLAANIQVVNVDNGQILFKRLCSACHLPTEQGQMAGPNLSNLTDRSPRALVEAILNPNRAVDPQYRSYLVLLENGEIRNGTIAEEIGDTITLVQADGKRVSIARREIEEIRNTGLSLMPEGMQAELTPQGMADIIEYIRSKLGK